jgi:DNA-binding NarL/FixJ family response regulator
MRLLIVDDHEVVRRGVRSLLSEPTGWEVCGEAVDGQDALDKARDLEADAIRDGRKHASAQRLEATRQPRNVLPQCEVLILSQREKSEMARLESEQRFRVITDASENYPIAVTCEDNQGAAAHLRVRHMDSVRILLADDHEPFRKSVRTFIEKQPNWQVCGEAADGVEAIEKAQELLPHIVLMDVSMPRLDGLQATRAIREKLPSAAIIIVSQNDPNVLSRQSAEVGAFSFVTKSNVAQDLVNSIEHAMQARTLIADSESNRQVPEQQSDGGNGTAYR